MEGFLRILDTILADESLHDIRCAKIKNLKEKVEDACCSCSVSLWFWIGIHDDHEVPQQEDAYHDLEQEQRRLVQLC